jgi:epoxyqueuosine reductase
MSELTKKIKHLAQAQGFDKIGITSANQPGKSKFLEDWLRNKHHGKMEWMLTHKKKRTDIHALYPGAMSVICVAQNYFVKSDLTQEEDRAKISRYAWGLDYHKVMKKKLKKLLRQIKEIDPDINGRICVDTAPIMEKIWAEKSGIGWQGKHTNIITREMGSWIFLGEIVVDKVLDYDLPAEDMCGSCSRCIQACPTDAITAPYVLDATKCISYLTIEYWDQPIPDQFKGQFNNFVFGCDICQDVCPWNKYQKETNETAYRPKNNNDKTRFKELEGLKEEEFKKRFNKSPVRRTGWKNFIRNVEFARDTK